MLFDCGADINTKISKNTDLMLVRIRTESKKTEKINALSVNDEQL